MILSQGNPNLKPDYRDRLQLTYTWNFGSNYFSPYVYKEFYSRQNWEGISGNNILHNRFIDHFNQIVQPA